MAELDLAAVGRDAPPASPEALRHEMDQVRDDMAENIRQLRQALSPSVELRRIARTQPAVVVALAAASGLLIALAVRSAVRKRRARRTILARLQTRARRW